MNETTTTGRHTYCAIRHDHPQPQTPSRICHRCEDQIHHWATTIPDLYALAPTFIEHGTTEGNPDSKATKRAEAAAPMRLEIIDLLDERLGRKWNGTAPAHDRRGILGTLLVHADAVIDERPLTATPRPRTVAAVCQLIDRHRLWAAEQTWVPELHADLRTTHRAISDAVGIYRRPPVGRCHIPTEEDQPCGGGLYANPYGGVRCNRCQATWDADHLRQLGLAQAAERQEETA